LAEKHEAPVIIKKNPSGFQKKPLLITVGKGVAKKATERNLIKRRIRAIISTTKLLDKGDVTIIARPSVVKTSFAELKAFIAP
jgi:ribonuclease P protein component